METCFNKSLLLRVLVTFKNWRKKKKTLAILSRKGIYWKFIREPPYWEQFGRADLEKKRETRRATKGQAVKPEQWLTKSNLILLCASDRQSDFLKTTQQQAPLKPPESKVIFKPFSWALLGTLTIIWASLYSFLIVYFCFLLDYIKNF